MKRQVRDTFFKINHLGTFPFSLHELLMPPATSGYKESDLSKASCQTLKDTVIPQAQMGRQLL